MERVYTAGTPSEAAIVQSELSAVGIESRVVGDEAYALRGVLPVDSSTLPMVLVHEDDFTRARKVILDWEQRNKQSESGGLGVSWTCECGERLEPQFKVCWSCGAERSSV